MAHLQNWFGLLPTDIATILPWSESLDKLLILGVGFSRQTNSCVDWPTHISRPPSFTHKMRPIISANMLIGLAGSSPGWTPLGKLYRYFRALQYQYFAVPLQYCNINPFTDDPVKALHLIAILV